MDLITTESDLHPVVTIAIPTFRRHELLKHSIASALGQMTSLPYEVLVIDNDQPIQEDYVLNLCRSFPSPKLRLVRNPINLGMVGNWNRCIELAHGEYLTILNDDDLLFDDFLSVIQPHLGSDHMILSDVEWFSESPISPLRNSNRMASTTVRIGLSDIFLGNPVNGSIGMVMRRNLASEIGGYDPAKWPSFDYDFTVRYILRYHGVKIQAKLAGYRWGVNESLQVNTIQGFIQQDYLLRRRVANLLSIPRVFRWWLEFSAWYLANDYAFRRYPDLNSGIDGRQTLSEIGCSILPKWVIKISGKTVSKILFGVIRVFDAIYRRNYSTI